MKKTHWLSLFCDIKATAVSFISILLFVALGIAIFLGIKWNEPALKNAADEYYKEHNFQDFALSFPYGITKEDIESVEALDNISCVEGSYIAYGSTWAGDERCVLGIQSLTENINNATVVEGVMPSASNEIGVEQLFADQSGLKVGDTLVIEEKDDDSDCFNHTTFTITAIVEHPAFVRNEAELYRGFSDMSDGSVDFFALVDKSAFNQETYDDCYPQIVIRGKNLSRWNTFGDEYSVHSDMIYSELKSLGKERGLLRCDELENRYDTELADAEKKIADADKKIKTGKRELKNRKQELADSEKKISEGEDNIADAEKQLETAEKEYKSSEKKYKEIVSKLKENRRRLKAMLKSAGFSTDFKKATNQIKSTKKQLEISISGMKLMNTGQNGEEAMLAELTGKVKKLDKLLDAVKTYNSNAGLLKEKKKELNKASGKITEKKEELGESKAELEDAKKQLKTGKEKLTKAQKKLNKGEKELAESKEELEDAKSQRDSFVGYDSWFVTRRSDNASYSTIINCAETSEKLCYSLALLFFFVGMMVCYTGISRIVRESKVLTGVQKALGLRKREIVTHYMVYALLAVVLGALLGAALAYWGIETIINGVYAGLFVYEKISNVFILGDFLVVTAIELVLIFLATWLPCRKLLSRQAVELIRGDNQGNARTRFYEKWKCWQRFSLYTQTTINNLVNDTTRVIATLVGVVGCTALIVMSLSLQLSLFDTPEKHFSDIGLLDDSLVYDGEVTGAKKEFEKILDGESADYTSVMQEAVYIEDPDGSKSASSIVVPEAADRLDNFIRLSDWKSGEDYSLPEDGVLITRNYTKFRDVDAGDSVQLIDMEGNYHECRIAGVIEYYLPYTQLIMSQEYYEKMMSESSVSNTFYIRYQEEPAESFSQKLKNVEGYYFCHDENDKWTNRFRTAFKSTSLVVYIGLALAAVMAFLVLLDLNVVFIKEKAKELIVMRINGFSVKKTKQYIYRDNIVLTILGILLGIVAGVALGIWVLSSLQKKGDNFYMVPNLTACLVGIGLSGVFSLITNIISLRQIDKMKVSDLNRLS